MLVGNGSTWGKNKSKSTTSWPLLTKSGMTRNVYHMPIVTKIKLPPLKTKRQGRILLNPLTSAKITQVLLIKLQSWRSRYLKVNSLIKIQKTLKKRVRMAVIKSRLKIWIRMFRWEITRRARREKKKTNRWTMYPYSKLTRSLTSLTAKSLLWLSSLKRRTCSILNKTASNSLKITISVSQPF